MCVYVCDLIPDGMAKSNANRDPQILPCIFPPWLPSVLDELVNAQGQIRAGQSRQIEQAAKNRMQIKEKKKRYGGGGV